MESKCRAEVPLIEHNMGKAGDTFSLGEESNTVKLLSRAQHNSELVLS